jgi:4-amino-4-deoxy-L-arabinose transferase-like glycosyltransferase
MRRSFEKLKTLPAIFLVALISRWGLFYYYYFIYKTPGGIPPTPFASDVYELLGRELVGGHGFSSWMFAYRPPLYPLFIAAVYALTGPGRPLVVVFVQLFLSASICWLTWGIARELGASEQVQKLAALLAAVDLTAVAAGQWLMAETLANFFIALSLLFLTRLLQRSRSVDAALCGGSLALSALARPNAIYFVLVAVILIIWLKPHLWLKAGVVLFVFVIGVLPWYLRNYAYHRLFTFATTSSFNLLFYKGVSVEQWATGKPATEIQTELAYELDNRLGIAGPRETYDHLSFWRNLVPADPRTETVMRDMAIEIYLTHPLTYVLLIPVSLVKLLLFSDLSIQLGTIRWLELGFNAVLYGLAIGGAILALRKRMWQWLSVTALPAAYFLAVPVITGGIQDTRARTNITSCLAVLAALGLSFLWSKRHER